MRMQIGIVNRISVGYQLRKVSRVDYQYLPVGKGDKILKFIYRSILVERAKDEKTKHFLP